MKTIWRYHAFSRELIDMVLGELEEKIEIPKAVEKPVKEEKSVKEA
jgi:hypothetical protein